MSFFFANVIQWWFFIFIIGIIFLPLSAFIFKKFYDKGYLFAKTLGIIATSYTVWLLSSLKIVKFSQIAILSTLFICALLIFIVFKQYKSFIELFKSKRLRIMFLIEELMFFITLTLWSFIRGLNPKINDLEKFMDFGFVNSVLRTDYMPPADMWFAGDSINYYYYGQYVSGYLTKLSGVIPSVAYNLMIATLFAFSFSLAFSLVFSLILLFKKDTVKMAAVGGTISALLLSLGGNLHTFVFTSYIPALKKLGFKIFSFIKVDDNYWYPDATRYIGHNPQLTTDTTIHEFPNYSFVVADLHAHVINIIFVITILALLVAFIKRTSDDIKAGDGKLNWKKLPIETYFIFLLVGTFQMTNYWDFPIYLTVSCFVFFYCCYIRYERKLHALLAWLALSFGNLIIALLVAWPFNNNFQKISSKIKILSLDQATDVKSPLYQLFVLWGFQLFFVAVFIITLFYAKRTSTSNTPSKRKKLVILDKNGGNLIFTVATLMLLSLTAGYVDTSLVWYGLAFAIIMGAYILIKYMVLPQEEQIGYFKEILKDVLIATAGFMVFASVELKFVQFIVFWVFLLIFVVIFILMNIDKLYFSFMKFVDFMNESPYDIYVLILAFSAIGLVFAPEFVYVKDIYNPPHHRANTMFKLTYQSFIMFSIIVGYIFVRVLSVKRTEVKRFLIAVPLVILIIMPMLYPIKSIWTWYGTNDKIEFKNYKTLNGLKYINENNRGDYEAIQWLNDNVTSQPVILEANGDSYTQYCRMSMATGLPTISGWYVHEWLWRSYEKNVTDIISARVSEIATVYESDKLEDTKKVLEKYKVKYIIIGDLERTKFSQLKEEKLLSLGSIAYQNSTVKIIEVKL